ncbi:MAG: hypothetical protein HPY50_13755 [Firmicutes bacterium]|nr:hypothetical protein [Bacillota bacterium]
MQKQAAADRLSSALIRIVDGRVNLLSHSSNFPFPDDALPARGSPCPTGTGAFEIYKGGKKVFKGVVPPERWIKTELLVGRPCVIREHSLKLEGQILTLLEIEATKND